MMVVLYLCLLGTKTKNMRLLAVLLGLAVLISLSAFNLFPEDLIDNY